MKELRAHCHVSLPTLFSVVLQKGWWEVTIVGAGKEGPWGVAADGHITEATLLAEEAQHMLHLVQM